MVSRLRSFTMRLRILALAGIVTGNASPAHAAQVSDAEALAMSRPQEQIVASDIESAHLTALLKPVEAFYGFWVNGSSASQSAPRPSTPNFGDHDYAGWPPPSKDQPSRPQRPSEHLSRPETCFARRCPAATRSQQPGLCSPLRDTGHLRGLLHSYARASTAVAADFICKAWRRLKFRDGT